MADAAPVQAAELSPAVGVMFEQPDVRVGGEGDANADTPAVAPDGTLIWSTPNSSHARPLSAAAAQGWIAAIATADGARIRSRPVDGPVLDTFGYGAEFWVSCTRGASDGRAWGGPTAAAPTAGSAAICGRSSSAPVPAEAAPRRFRGAGDVTRALIFAGFRAWAGRSGRCSTVAGPTSRPHPIW